MEMQWKQREGERTENKRRDGADGKEKKKKKDYIRKEGEKPKTETLSQTIPARLTDKERERMRQRL